MPRTFKLTVGANLNWRSKFFLRHCLLLVLHRSSLFFAARHNDRAGGDRAAGVSDERSERRAAPEHVGDSGPVEVEGFMFSVLRLYILRGVLVSVLVLVL